jgi:SAM-dependent methyltransferase
MYFWNELEKCFSEIKRILKPNGIFLNVVYTREFLDKIIYTKYGFNKYSIDDVIKITEDNGMTIVKLVEIKKNNTYCVISKNAA